MRRMFGCIFSHRVSIVNVWWFVCGEQINTDAKLTVVDIVVLVQIVTTGDECTQ